MDDDVILAVKELAELRGSTAGEVLSELARAALSARRGTGGVRNGVPLLEPRSGEGIVTEEVVDRLRDDSCAAAEHGAPPRRQRAGGSLRSRTPPPRRRARMVRSGADDRLGHLSHHGERTPPVLSNPAYAGRGTTVADAAERLQRFVSSGGHEFWNDDVSLLATFDRGLRLAPVRGAQASHVCLVGVST